MTHLRDGLIEEIEDLPTEDNIDVYEIVLDLKWT
jgi:tRNA-binding EMAP/Myf-like protein